MNEEELNKAVQVLKEEARLRAEINSGFDGYVNGLKEYKKIQQTINRNAAIAKKLEEDKVNLSAADKIIQQQKIDLLKKQNLELEKTNLKTKEMLANTNKTSSALAKAGSVSFKAFSQIPGLIKAGYGQLKSSGLFEMDKAMKTSALQMGVLSKQSVGFRKTIKSASWETNKIGLGIKEVSEMQSIYSEEIGRAVQLNDKGLISMGKIAAATGLGADGAARLAAEMETQGISSEKTSEFIQQTMNDSHKMGLNASKVVKNISGNIRMLNKYNFKNGVNGLKEMAMTATKLGVNMDFATGMADKLFDIEGAIDMSAQLNVMGGAWAKLADPFHLMYMARNDMAGLTKEIGNAAKASASFNDKGEVQITAMEMHRLRKIAEQTGLEYEQLAEAGKKAFKLDQMKGQVSSGLNDEEKEFLANMSEFKDGKAYIRIDGSDRLVKTVNQGTVKALMAEQESLEDRAKNARTFDEALNNTINGLKNFLLPIIEVINAKLLPKIDEFTKNFEKNGWGAKIEKIADTVGSFIATIGGFIIDNPMASAILAGTAMFGGMLLDKAMWFANGIALAAGFNTGTGGGGLMSTLQNLFGKGKAAKKAVDTGKTLSKTGRAMNSAKGLAKTGGKVLGKAADIAAPLMVLKDQYDFFSDKKTRDTGASGWLESLGGAGMDLLDWIPGINQLTEMSGLGVDNMATDNLANARAIYRKMYPSSPTVIPNKDLFSDIKRNPGNYTDDIVEDAEDVAINDGLIRGVGKKKGSNFSKGRGIIQGGRIHPIDNKDDLLALKPNGIVDNTMNTGTSVIKHDFGEITFNGEIKVTSPGNPGFAIDLLSDPGFKRDITRTIQSELQKNKIGGKNKG